MSAETQGPDAATMECGWVCEIGCHAYDDPAVPYPSPVQTWAHDFMADGPPPNPFAAWQEEEQHDHR